MQHPVLVEAALRAAARTVSALLLLCALALTASAQEAAPAATPPAPPPKEIPVVATADIGVEVEKVKANLAKFEAELAPSELAAAVEAKLPDLVKRAEALLETSAKVRASDPNLQEMDEASLQLGNMRGEIETAQDSLRVQSADIDEKLVKLREQREKWSATHDASSQDEAPKAVLDLISEVDRAITAADKVAKKRQGSLVELQGQVAALDESLRSEAEATNTLRGNLVGEVFQADRQPLWSTEVWSQLGSESFADRIREERDRELERAKLYAENNNSLLMLHGLAFLALYASMLAVRRRVATTAISDDALAKIQAIFDRPLSMAVLLVFLLTIWTLPELPRGLRQLLGIFLLGPAVIILRRISDRAAFPILNALLVFFVLDRIQQVLVLLPDAARIVFTLEMLGVLGLLLWWRRPSRMSQLPEATSPRALRLIGLGVRVAMAGSFAAIVCSVLGYSALGLLIGTNVLYGAYTAVVLYGGARALDGLSAFLLRVRPLRLSRLARRNRAELHRRSVRAIHVLAGLWWIQVALTRLEIFDAVWAGVISIFTAEATIGEASIQVGDVVAFVFTVWASFAISNIVRFVLEEDIYPRFELAKGMPYAVSALTHYCILLVGFFLAIIALGVDTSRFALLAGAFGVGIGFGLQNIVNNFVSGLILLTERPVEVGDTVSVSETFGIVQRIGIRSSTVRTWQGAEVIVPNANFVSEEVTNWTHSDTRRRMEIPVGVPYGTDPALVIEVLTEATQGNEDILKDPEPYVLFMNYGDSSLDFEVRAWTSEFDKFLRVRSQVMLALTAALAENGIEIPFPQRDLHVKTLPAQTPTREEDETS